jgi:hypothetical protein
LGFGGRARSLPNAAERARQAVTKAIRSAIKRIGNPQPALAHYLLRHINTGYVCSYEPDPASSRRLALLSDDRAGRPVSTDRWRAGEGPGSQLTEQRAPNCEARA